MTKIKEFMIVKPIKIMGTRFEKGDVLLTVDGKKVHAIFSDCLPRDYDLAKYDPSTLGKLIANSSEMNFEL